MTKKNQNFIIAFGVLMVFVGILVSVAVKAETGAGAPPDPNAIPSPSVPSEKAFSSAPLPSENNPNLQEQAPASPSKNILAGGIENLGTWNLIVTVLLIISLLFNIYFGLKIRYILRKIETTY